MQMAFPREVGLVGAGSARRLVQAPITLPATRDDSGFLFAGKLTGELALPSGAPAVIDLAVHQPDLAVATRA